jgi:asparagine synthase (glutamine-hydrolysing)
MCGFSAVVALDGQRPDLAVVKRMSTLLAHRGPDDDGLFEEAHVALAFRRLAILDLAPSSHQPMLSADARHVIVFNGEIYNFLELRDELKSLGHVFASQGDTEVLLAAYRQWGSACLERLNGMWAFVIYDRRERTLFGARDRFGVKPLFVYRDARVLVLASEIKAIRDSGAASLATDWRTVAAHLLEDRLDADTRSFYEGVQHLPAGTAFEVDARGNMRSWKYWSLERIIQEPADDGDPVEAFRSLFADSVRLRMRSDVPVGVQLSGGLDSTSIISSMARQLPAGAPLFAFCYMAPQFDETAQIEATLAQTNAQLVRLESTPTELWHDLQAHLWYQDEPVHSFTSVVGYRLMALARSHGVKVLLNGQGADEVLAGYANYFDDYWADLLSSGRLLTVAREMGDYAQQHGRSATALGGRSLRRLLQYVASGSPGYAALAAHRRQIRLRANPWVSDRIKNYLQPQRERPAASLVQSLRRSVESAPLPLYLRVEDRNSMAHGVEVRLPFLDYRLVTLSFRLGAQWKISGASTKQLLRQAMRGQIPEIVRTQVRKLGFPTPMDEWFRGELYEPLQDLLSSRNVREADVWNLPAVSNAARRHRSGEISCGGRLFDVAQVSLWLHGVGAWPRMAIGTSQRAAGVVT